MKNTLAFYGTNFITTTEDFLEHVLVAKLQNFFFFVIDAAENETKGFFS